MQNDPQQLINDHFFLQALSCPLKIPFLLNNSLLGSERPVFRQRNKLHLRDAVALRYQHRKYTTAHTGTAAAETSEWLKKDDVTICGAVLQTGKRQTRIPILVKKKDKFTIVQVHGKLRKSSEQKALLAPGKKKSTAINLLKAAYRTDVLLELIPNAEIEIHFFFPDKHFRASKSHLHSMVGSSDPSLEAKELLHDLFLNVDATKAVNDVLKSIPDNVAHTALSGLSVREAFDSVYRMSKNPDSLYLDNGRHSGCSSCDYRQSGKFEEGCWSQNFEPDDLRSSQSHVYDLIGHGNQFLVEKGVYYQENVEITDGLETIDLIRKYGGSKFTMQQRRNLQILKSKRETVPLLWLRKGIEKIRSFRFPLHFIDFEAATYAIPMLRGTNPYTPLYFQFSCHTLNEDKSVYHTSWLQKDTDVERIHEEFVERLASIHQIFEGTIVHFSPFEKQALNRLSADFNRNSMLYSSQIDLLSRLKTGQDKDPERRFFDLSELVRDYYYNRELKGSLGIKDVLLTVLKTEEKIGELPVAKSLFPGIDTGGGSDADPYRAIQNGNSVIMDGAAAMHAWISQKNGLLTDEESASVSALLESYCTLDSLSMLAVYNHIDQFYSINTHDDVILF
jgi:hypothetical protein